jgi:hypothetical protein
MIKTITKSKSSPLVAGAKQWAALWRREKLLVKSRKELGERLMSTMKAEGVTEVSVGHGLHVAYIQSKSKRVSKGALLFFFGIEDVERFWATLPDELSEYLSLAKEKKA